MNRYYVSALLLGLGLFSNLPTTALAAEAPTNHFVWSYKLIPHMEKRDKGGEDAQFSNKNLLVVADGVGGWANQGIDSGLFSKELVSHIGDLYNN